MDTQVSEAGNMQSPSSALYCLSMFSNSVPLFPQISLLVPLVLIRQFSIGMLF